MKKPTTNGQKEVFVKTWHKLEQENSLRGFDELIFKTGKHGNILSVKTETRCLETWPIKILLEVAGYWDLDLKLTGNGIGVVVELTKKNKPMNQNQSPFLERPKAQNSMDDWELLEFLLESPFVGDQLDLDETYITANVKPPVLYTDFFHAMENTGRHYEVSNHRIWFPRPKPEKE